MDEFVRVLSETTITGPASIGLTNAIDGELCAASLTATGLTPATTSATRTRTLDPREFSSSHPYPHRDPSKASAAASGRRFSLAYRGCAVCPGTHHASTVHLVTTDYQRPTARIRQIDELFLLENNAADRSPATVRKVNE